MAAPWLPRMHLFEIHDQPWQDSLSLPSRRNGQANRWHRPNPYDRFPPWFRAKVQAALTETWTTTLRPLGQRESPALIASRVLAAELGDRVGEYVFVDYCSGGGGPTPSIERFINAQRGGGGGGGGGGAAPPPAPAPALSSPPPGEEQNGVGTRSRGNKKTKEEENGAGRHQPLVHFVLTDLHPHIPNWARAASFSPQLHHAPFSVDASSSPPDLLARASPPLPPSHSHSLSRRPSGRTKTFRTFHLAFHHFPDPLAASILRDALSASDGLAIVELQDRTLRSFLSVLLLGLGVLFFAPLYAWRWRSPATLFWCWVVPVLPLVLVWDGWMSSVRTRTVGEVTALMTSCGVPPDEVDRWDVTSGRITHLPPCADVNWIIATKRVE